MIKFFLSKKANQISAKRLPNQVKPFFFSYPSELSVFDAQEIISANDKI
jgi:hypothetical protein